MMQLCLFRLYNIAMVIIFDKKSTKEIYSLMEQKEKPQNILKKQTYEKCSCTK